MKRFTFLFSYRSLLVIVLLEAAYCRFLGIDFQSLWLDEIYTMNMADPANSFADIYRLSQTTDPLSVLYFMLLNVTFKLFGFEPVVARAFSVLLGVAGVYFIYLLGRELRNRETGLIAAVLLSVNYFHIYYSQEARVYTMFMAFTCLSFYNMLRFSKNPTGRLAVYYGLSALLAVLSHFFGLLILGAQAIYLLGDLFQKEKALRLAFFRKLCMSAAIVLVGYLPMIPIFLWLSGATSSWIPVPSNNAFLELFNGFFGNSPLPAALITLFIVYYLVRLFQSAGQNASAQSKEDGLLWGFYPLVIWLAVSFLVPYVRSFITLPVLHSRYLISVLPVFILMAAIGINLIENKTLSRFVAVLVILCFAIDMFIVKNYYSGKVKSDFRGASIQVVSGNILNSTIYTSLPYHFGFYLRYYKNQAPVSETPVDLKLDKMRTGAEAPEAFWAIGAHGRTFSISDTNARYLSNNFNKTEAFTGLDAWALYFVPKEKPDTVGLVMLINALNFDNTVADSSDTRIYLYNNGTRQSRDFSLPAGNYKLVLTAQPFPVHPIAGEYPRLKVFANNNLLGSFFVNPLTYTKGQVFNYKQATHGKLKLALEYDNDVLVKGLDRNIGVKQIAIYRN